MGRTTVGTAVAVHRLSVRASLATTLASAASLACATAITSAAQAPAGGAGRGAPTTQCLPDGTGYLSAQIRGAIAANIDWRNALLECEGGMRPDGHGIRVSFAGLAHFGGAAHRLRFIFGIATAGEGLSGHALPTNVTLILEGEKRIFSTGGDGKCTVDELSQVLIAHDARHRDYRVSARGFCVGPAARLGAGRSGDSARVLVSRFDFRGRISLYTETSGTDRTGTNAGEPRAGDTFPSDARRLLP